MFADKGLVYRCSICAALWPYKSKYQNCPSCGEPCWYKKLRADEFDNVHSEAEADRLLAHSKRYEAFEKYCAERDRRLLTEEAEQLASLKELVLGEM